MYSGGISNNLILANKAIIAFGLMVAAHIEPRRRAILRQSSAIKMCWRVGYPTDAQSGARS
jgi:hypothetical protein